ncbi:M4 family metallopeptidase [bacterium]|nr:M4 family metallopeptidase [bacterium]
MASQTRPPAGETLPNVPPTEEQLGTIKTWGASAVFDPKTGVPTLLTGKLSTPEKGDLVSQAVAFFEQHRQVYRMRNASLELRLKLRFLDELQFENVRLTQVYQGLEVFGGELVVSRDKEGVIYAVTGRYVPGIDLQTTPSVESRAAIEKAIADLDIDPGDLETDPPAELLVFAGRGRARLAYRVTVETAGPGNLPGARWICFYDAHTGEVLLRYDDIKHHSAPGNGMALSSAGKSLPRKITNWQTPPCRAFDAWYSTSNALFYLSSLPRHTFTLDNERTRYIPENKYVGASTNSPVCENSVWTDRTEVGAHVYTQAVADYFRVAHGRDGLNAAGSPLKTVVHCANPGDGNGNYDNAGWTGTYAIFGDGGYLLIDGKPAYRNFAALDIIAHEYTHGVTDFSADLVYANEPGALNESFSDMFGAAIEHYFGTRSEFRTGSDTPNWTIGEDAQGPGLDAPIRDMSDPSRVPSGTWPQPTFYRGENWYSGNDDNGGVHVNSGVPNYAFYQLSMGNSRPYNEGADDSLLDILGDGYRMIPFRGIGVENAARIAYRALTVHLTPYSQMIDGANAFVLAAQTLNPAWVPAVRRAWTNVGLRPTIETPMPPCVADTEYSWLRKQPMPTPRTDLAAASLGGTIYALGGFNPQELGVVRKVEAYDPVMDEWKEAPNLSVARRKLAAAALDGRIYAAGGMNDFGISVSTVDAYSPGNSAWTSVTSLPTSRYDLMLEAVNGKLYAIGGLTDLDAATRTTDAAFALVSTPSTLSGTSIPGAIERVEDLFVVRDVEIFEPSQSRWTRGQPMPTVRFGASSAVLDGKIYVAGGFDALTDATGKLEVYDPATDRWKELRSMPTPRAYLKLVAMNGSLFAIGGRDMFTYPAAQEAMVERYNPATDLWERVQDMPTPRESLAAAVGCSLYAVGGIHNEEILNQLEAYEGLSSPYR